MDIEEEKKNLLLELIAFSKVDGHLHKKEYEFLFLLANELNIEKGVFNDLFYEETPKPTLKTEFKRLQQFYRLALLMHSDGILHEKETNAIYQISIRMGLNPDATKRVLAKMQKAPNATLSPEVILQIFKE